MFPQGSLAAVNLFGFYKSTPSIAVLLPELEKELPWIQTFKSLDGFSPQEIAIANIPAVLYPLENTPFSKTLDWKTLVVMERDTLTYVFDSEIAGKNYFGELNSDPAGKNRRNPALRNLLEKVYAPAQIKGVLSQDFFAQWLASELKRISKTPRLMEEMKQLSDEIKPFLQPVSSSAGIRENEWFLDAYVPSAGGLMLDTILLSAMMLK